MVHKFSTCLPRQRQSLIPSPWDGLNLVTYAYWISKGRIDGITLSRYAYKRTSSGTLTHCLIADRWGWSSTLPLSSCQLSSGRRVPTHTEGVRSAPLWPPLPPPMGQTECQWAPSSTSHHLIQPYWCWWTWRFRSFSLEFGLRVGIPTPFFHE